MAVTTKDQSSSRISESTKTKLKDICEKDKGLFLFVGRNGAGKTTLLNFINNKELDIIKDHVMVNLNEDEETKEIDDRKKTQKTNYMENINEQILKEKEKYKVEKINEIIKEDKYKGKIEELKEILEKEISENMDKLLQDKTKFGIEGVNPIFKEKTSDKLFKLFELEDLSVKFKGREIKLKELPTGLKRIFVWFLTEKNKGDKKKKIWTVDEVEKFLHPNFIKLFCSILSEISKKHLIFISTHSPLVIRELRNHLKNFYFVWNNEKEKININIKQIWDEKEVTEYQDRYEQQKNELSLINHIKMHLQFLDTAKIFFTQKLILVEGPNDQIIFENLFDSDCEIITMGGAYELKHIWSLVYLLKKAEGNSIENVLVLLDLDQKYQDHDEDKKLKKEMQNNNQLIYVGNEKVKKLEALYQKVEFCEQCSKKNEFNFETLEKHKEKNTNAFKFAMILQNNANYHCLNEECFCNKDKKQRKEELKNFITLNDDNAKSIIKKFVSE